MENKREIYFNNNKYFLRDRLSKKEQNFAFWIIYFRENPEVFIEEYLGIKLFAFQKALVRKMFQTHEVVFIASRGVGKTFVEVIAIIAYCILYPNTYIVLTSGTKEQANQAITFYIEGYFKNNYPAIANEISKISTGKNAKCDFTNGSVIESVPPSDNSRGRRAGIIVEDESRQIKKEISDDVFKKMHNGYARVIKGLVDNFTEADVSKYRNDEEIKSIIRTTSAWYKSNHMWDRFKDAFKDMNTNGMSFAVGIPYYISIEYGLVTIESIIQEKSRTNYNPIAFMIENEAIFFGEGADAFYKLSHFENHRKLSIPFIVKEDMNDYKDYNGNYDKWLDKERDKLPRTEDERRVMSIDVALLGGKRNDKTSIGFCRMIPRKDHYLKKWVGLSSLHGYPSEKQAMYIKRWFYQFDCDTIVLDIRSTSMAVFEQLVRPIEDTQIGVTYPAWRIYNTNMTEQKTVEYMERTIYEECEDVIFGIAADVKFNHDAMLKLKSTLENSSNQIEFLKNSMTARSIISSKYKSGISPEDEAEELVPFVETDAMVNECIMLETQISPSTGMIGVVKKRNIKKDRYSMLSYGNYVMSLMDSELEDRGKEYNVMPMFD